MQNCVLASKLIILMTVSAVRGAKWAYDGPDGELHWSKHYPFCGGVFQSPIDIQTHLMRFDPTLRPIEVRNYNLSANEQLTLGNDGHSVRLSLPSRMHISGLPHRYTAAQLHFHWGSSNLPGSEHTINSKQFAAEMHVVHFNSDKYANVSMAADKPDGLAVLGVLMEVGEFNPAFDQFLKYINGIKYRGQRVQVPAFNIRGLLPTRLDEYYRYDGSLTTPPCYPSVLWTIFRSPVSISLKQFVTLATALYASHSQESAPVPLNGNYRKPQLADSRVVLVSFKEGQGLHGGATLTVTSPLMRRQVIQKLAVGDLADLADEEGLNQLLPNLRQKPRSGNTWSNNIHPSWGQTSSKQRWLKAKVSSGNAFALWKNAQGTRYLLKSGLDQDKLSFAALEQNIVHQLSSAHTEAQLVQALREEVFPELNLRSYLDGKSDLAMATIRLILRGRPSDEANELQRVLTQQASAVHRKSGASKPRDTVLNKYGGLPPAAVPRKPHIPVRSYPWLQPMEWED